MEQQNATALAGKKIVLGVTGGIAAYKAVEITSRLRKAGAEVHVIMTRGAENFVTELTFREISNQPVTTDMWAEVPHYHVEHIALATLADAVLIAPATANIIAKAAAGIADDMLTTTLLATKAPVFVAPAMNTNMYEAPVTQRNLRDLAARGWHIIEPASGMLACGVEGKGRLPEPAAIVQELTAFFAKGQALAGRKVLVTAGGTIEPLDPVRYLGNRSTGRMGYAIAQQAASRGAEVVLISGPSALPVPEGVRIVRVETARQMREAVLKEYPDTDQEAGRGAHARTRAQPRHPLRARPEEGASGPRRLCRRDPARRGLRQGQAPEEEPRLHRCQRRFRKRRRLRHRDQSRQDLRARRPHVGVPAHEQERDWRDHTRPCAGVFGVTMLGRSQEMLVFS